MKPREVCFLIGRGGAVLWADVSHSPVLLPDSRARWEAIWHHREELEEIAHSHPIGPLAFSAEDESTMEALALALPRAPHFSVVAPGGMVRRPARHGASSGEEEREERDEIVNEEPFWAVLLRAASGMQTEE